MNLHTGEKPFVCRECKRGFFSAASWRRHERMAHEAVTACMELTDNQLDSKEHDCIIVHRKKKLKGQNLDLIMNSMVP